MTIALLLGACATSSTWGADTPAPVEGDDYESGDYGRVRDAPDGVAITRAQWNHEQGVADQGVLNSPLFPGDEVSTDSRQEVEVQLAGGTLVWVGHDSKLTFLALPAPYAEVTDHAVLQLAAGATRLSTTLGADDELRLDTPSASVYPLADADLRVEVLPGGGTRVTSRRGVVELVAGGGSVLVRGGMRAEVDPGGLPGNPLPFNTFTSDSFDRYVDERVAATRYPAANSTTQRSLPDEVQPYYGELSANGRWVETNEYGTVWVPGDVPPDWRPYQNGYWAYGPNGYFWVSDEPWGWAPYHYGRWTWIDPYGWCWSAGAVFGGAWVGWSWGSTYVGWAPLDYWGYPAYHSAWYYGYYDPFCWSFVAYVDFHDHHHHHDDHHHDGHHDWDHVSHDAEHTAVVTRPPRVSPDRLATSREARAEATREAASDPTRRLAPSRESRQGQPSFRTRETPPSRGTATAGGGVRNRRVETAPAGRARTVPVNAARAGRGLPATVGRSVDPTGRARVPVSETPQGRRGAGGRSTGRVTKPPSAGARDGGEAARPETGAGRSGNELQAPRHEDSVERVRDMYRKMSRPRTTSSPPAAGAPSRGGTRTPGRAPGRAPGGGSGGGRARPTPPPSKDKNGSGATTAAPPSGGPQAGAPSRGVPRHSGGPWSGGRRGGGGSPSGGGRSSGGGHSGGGRRARRH